jgi:hypothetical protein
MGKKNKENIYPYKIIILPTLQLKRLGFDSTLRPFAVESPSKTTVNEIVKRDKK